MANTWYPTNFSGFYANGTSYYKLMLQVVSLGWVNKKFEAKIDPTSFQVGF